MSAPTVLTRLAQIAECGQQRVMRLGWERPGSLAGRPVLTNRMREYFTYGSVGGAGGNPGSYPAANRRLAWQSDGSDSLSATVAADRAFPAAVAELGRWFRKRASP